MSFFGQPNNQQSTGFGGFGSNSNTGTGFGQTQNTGFGSGTNSSGGGLFGNTGFSSGGTGFGAGASNSTAPFGGGTSAFGSNATTSSSLFGGTPATANSSTGFGGFGGSNTNNTSNSLFGGTGKSTFGGNTSGGSLFGGGTTGTGFGSTTNQPSSAFGAPISSALAPATAESQGTGSTPFQPFTEKESGSNVANQYQSISFMQPYKNFSFEELRQADYNQGRRYGNGSGQAGAFGTSTGFGGFGQQNNSGPFGSSTSGSGSGLFGGQSTTSASPFGGTQTAGFGSSGNAGGGLFGAGTTKPAGGGLFGTNSSAQPSGGVFGTNPQSGFGTNTSTGAGFGNSSGGGGLFGTGTQQQASNPGFSFGGANTGNAFGGSSTATGTNTSGLFGNQPTSTFGSGQQSQQSSAANPFGGIGSNQNPGQTGTANPFGGFGNANQQPPKTGLFGSTPANTAGTGGGLFSNNQLSNPQTTTNSLFGPSGNQPGSSSIFGPKTQSTGAGIFGNAPQNTNNTTSGGLFGSSGFTNPNNQTQPNQGGLFGSNNQQQQGKSGGMFGNAGSTIGNGLFGNNNQSSNGTSLFGNAGSNGQQQSTGLFGQSNNNASTSIFGNLQQQQPSNALQPPQPQIASFDNQLPYGSASIYNGLPPPPLLNAGPIATPISPPNRLKKSSVLPQYKINPNQASRLVTPQKRGFGFSYSTYGTPSSVSSTPGGLNSGLLQSSIGRTLSKSLSTSNLRRSFDNDGESILSPGAFSAGSSRFSGTGSLKKLTIDRSLRTDLFGGQGLSALSNTEKIDQSKQPGILKKKVSFDASTVGGNGDGQDTAYSTLIDGSTSADSSNGTMPSAQEQGFLRSSSRGHNRLLGPKLNGVSPQLDIEQVKGNELAVVHEDESVDSIPSADHRQSVQSNGADPEPKSYWMKPSQNELDKLPKEDLRHVAEFSVGREGCGWVEFNEPVDLTLTPLDDIYEKLVLIEVRSLTVYPDSTLKPPRGKGMNVPSTIYLENSWPRQKDRRTPLHEKSGPRFNKHVDRLRKVTGTEFVRYEKDTGIWVFKVPHFTTYAFDYDDAGSDGDSLYTSTLSAAPETPTPKSRQPGNGLNPRPNTSVQESESESWEGSLGVSSPDDTFEFRKKKLVPGAFSEFMTWGDQEMEEVKEPKEILSREGLANPSSVTDDDKSSKTQTRHVEARKVTPQVESSNIAITGSFPNDEIEAITTGINEGFLRSTSPVTASQQVQLGFSTPGKLTFNQNGDWAEELQRTISPRKQDRQVLREKQAYFDEEPGFGSGAIPKMQKLENVAEHFATSIDLMNSIFGTEQAQKKELGTKKNSKGKAFEWPYPKASNPHGNGEDDMNEADQRFHRSYKPQWGPQTTLLYAMPSKFDSSQGPFSKPKTLLVDQKGTFVSEGRDIRFAKFAIILPLTPRTLHKQRDHTRISVENKVPFAEAQKISFQDLARSVLRKSDPELTLWEVASILFDELEPETSIGEPAIELANFQNRIRKDRLIRKWETICKPLAGNAIATAPSAEEKAIAQLSVHNVAEACDELIKGKDFRLATLTAQIGGDHIIHEEMRRQIKEWRDLNVLAEMTDPIRALYELLSGNACFCEGKKGPLEDRAKSFVISERFNLDWKRAFGLRLWYAIRAEESIEAAIQKYADDLNGHETQKPITSFHGDQAAAIWSDPTAEQREDVIWGLLKLFAASMESSPIPSIISIVSPHNITGNPIDYRLSFQLYQALVQRFPLTSEDKLAADHITLDFATQLDSAGEWLWSAFVLLHLSDPDQRQRSLRTLLAQHASEIPDIEKPEFHALSDELKIPPEWIWEAKALHARSVTQDHGLEVQYLLQAQNWDEAHHTLCRIVAPKAVIEHDYESLARLLKEFEEGKVHIGNWTLGGQIYEDFISLLGAKENPGRKVGYLKRLMGGLRGMVQENEDAENEEKAAIAEISRVVAREVAMLGREKKEGMEGEKGVEIWRVLQLPLTDDAILTHSREMGLSYYRAIMAG